MHLISNHEGRKMILDAFRAVILVNMCLPCCRGQIFFVYFMLLGMCMREYPSMFLSCETGFKTGLMRNTVQPRCIVAVTIVFPQILSVLFGPGISPI
jgi:hypothetical protein